MSSHEYFNKLWAEAQADFRRVLQDEKAAAEARSRFPPSLASLTELHYKYVSILRKLDQVYDLMVHPQKRPLVRKVLDLVLGRLLEIRGVMTSLEKSEVLYFDDLLHYYHWIPTDLDLPIPSYYLHSRDQAWRDKERWLADAVGMKAAAIAAEEASEEAAAAERAASSREMSDYYMDLEEATSTLQTMERARQGRIRYHIGRVYWEQDERQRSRKVMAEASEIPPDAAATIIQKNVRGWLARKKVSKMRLAEMEFLGFTQGVLTPGSDHARRLAEAEIWRSKAEDAAEKRRRTQRRYQTQFEEGKELIEARLRLLEGPEMAERMKYQLRKWILYVKEKTGKLPDLPKREHGGSRLIFCPDALPEDVLAKAVEKSDKKNGGKKPGGKKNGDKEKGGGGGKKKKGKDKGAKKKGGGGGDTGLLGPPAQLEEMVKANIEYNSMWRSRDERRNPEQKYEEDLVVREKRMILGEEIRTQVDVMMKSELSILKGALEKRKKKKKGKGKKGKKGKGRKGKKGKKKRKKKGKDLTPDRTTQSLFEELVNAEVIRPYPKVHLAELVGEISLINGTLRRVHATEGSPRDPEYDMKYPGSANPLPTMGDVIRAIKDLCVLPMGSKIVHEMAPQCKSLLIAGPEGSGKRALVHWICTELGATLFDLTAANIAGKYPGKPGLNMLIHLVNKVGRLVSPTVILIEDCERTYQKRVPKGDRTEPKRLKKQLPKFLKSLAKDDLILVIGLSSEPWVAPIKAMKKDFPRVIFIPRPDYGSRREMWKHVLFREAGELHEDVHLSLLAKLSDGWTLGSIQKLCQKVLERHLAAVQEDNEKRARMARVPTEVASQLPLAEGHGDKHVMIELLNKMLNPMFRVASKRIRMDDLIDEMTLVDPVFLEQDKAWSAWFNKTALQKARLKMQIGGGDAKKKRGKKGAKGEKKKKGGKKKR